MAKIYRKSDRIKIKIDDITLTVSPLSTHEKNEIQALMVSGQSRGDVSKITAGIQLAMKYGIKGISGVTDINDNDYQLDFIDGMLSDECVDDLLNMDLSKSIINVCSNLIAGFSSKMVDENGDKLEGVEVVNPVEKKS